MALSGPETEVHRERLRERLLVRLGGFIQGIGLSVKQARQIVERAIAHDLSSVSQPLRLQSNRAYLRASLVGRGIAKV